MSNVDLADIARDVVARASTRIPVAVRVVRTDMAAETRVRGNADHLRVVVANLVDNATRHARSRVDVACTRIGGDVVLTIEDDGTGIPSDALPKIFDRFFRVDAARSSEHGGAGLGLSIVRVIAELHGGSARAESTLEVGSKLVVTFPAQDGTP